LSPKPLARLVLKLVLALTWLLAHLPKTVNLALGDFVGWLFYRLSRRRRHIAIDNISQAIANGSLNGDRKAAAIALDSFKGLGRTALESFCLMHRGLDYFQDSVELIGGQDIPELIKRAKDSGSGLIFLPGHAGNWELSTAAVPSKFNIALSVVGRSQGWLSNEILTRIRSKGGGQFIFKDGGAKDMLRLLRGGGFLGTLFDQASIVGPDGVKLTFMGRPALTTLGPLRLAARTGAALVPLFCRREGKKHVIEIYSPIFPPSDPKNRKWQISEAQALNDLLADFLRRHPEQWMWSHRRWKMPRKHRTETVAIQ
jgi:KDO2-lipid IV(A) lauroyltransferase